MELENNAFLCCCVFSVYLWLLNTVVHLKAVRSNLLPFLPSIKDMSCWVHLIWWVTHVLLIVTGVLGVWGLVHYGSYCSTGTREGDKCLKLSKTNLEFLIASIVCGSLLVGYGMWCLWKWNPEPAGQAEQAGQAGQAEQPSGQPSGQAEQPSGQAEQAEQPSGQAEQPSGQAEQPSGQPSGQVVNRVQITVV